ncbi:MAG: zinc-ribbon domain containing protein [Terracidiphilus sp.]
MDFVDKELQCVDCGAVFVFSAGEQKFYEERGFTNVPKHCKQCKAQRTKGIVRTVETRVKCSQCGTATTVPFKLTQNRPVLCRACFTRRGKGESTQATTVR